MMDIRIRTFIISAMLFVLFSIILMVRRKSLELRYALIWLILSTVVLLLSIFPSLMERIAYMLRIASPMNMLFFFGFCFSLLIIFSLTVALSRMSIRIKDLAQEIALLQHDSIRRNDESED